jgi:hypothetical protein
VVRPSRTWPSSTSLCSTRQVRLSQNAEFTPSDLVIWTPGTLTEGGAPRVTDVTTFPEECTWTRSRILGIANALESASSHPLATAIRSYCEQEKATPVEAFNFEEVSGRGLKAYIKELGATAVIGNEAWMIQHGAFVSPEDQQLLNGWKEDAKSVVLLALSSASSGRFSLAAAFGVADVIRPEAKSVIADLKKQGLDVWMVSGDNIMTARAVARIVGINETNIVADVLPHEKVCGQKLCAGGHELTVALRLRKSSGCNEPDRSEDCLGCNEFFVSRKPANTASLHSRVTALTTARL